MTASTATALRNRQRLLRGQALRLTREAQRLIEMARATQAHVTRCRLAAPARRAMCLRGGSDDEDQKIAVLISSKLLMGVLPATMYTKSRYTYGSERPCAGCDQLVGKRDVQVYVDFTAMPSLRFHGACFVVW